MSRVKILLDSDVIIDYLRTGEGFFMKLLDMQIERRVEIYVSSVTVMELFAGKSAEKQDKLLAQLVENLQVIDFGKPVAKLAGKIKRGKKTSMSLADFMIGVSAIFLGAKLVTRNKKHFKDLEELEFFDVDEVV